MSERDENETKDVGANEPERTVRLVKPKKDSKTGRLSMRVYPKDVQKLAYWSEAFDMDQTEFLMTAMHHYIKWRNQDYDLPTAEIQRLNQLVDAIDSLTVNQGNLQKSVVNGFDAMLGIIRGDNYLVEDDDGKL